MNTILRGVNKSTGKSAINIPGGYFHPHTVDFTLHNRTEDSSQYITEPWTWPRVPGNYKSKYSDVMEKTVNLFLGKWKAFAVPYFERMVSFKDVANPTGRNAFEEMLQLYHKKISRLRQMGKAVNGVMFCEEACCHWSLSYHFNLMPF